MRHYRRNAGQIGDISLQVVFASFFPPLICLHAHASIAAYQAMSGIVLGGVGALSHALLYDGYLRWRTHGMAGLERTRSLRLLMTTLVYPSLSALSIVIWLASNGGADLGMAHGIGAGIGGGLIGWRSAAVLARRRRLSL